MRARTLAFLPILSFVLVSCAGIGGAIDETSNNVRGFVNTTSDKIGGLFERQEQEEAKALQATVITSEQPVQQISTVRTVQQLLTDAGYSPGPADGIYGPKTRTAIIAYQRKIGLPHDGRISQKLIASLQESEKSTIALLEEEHQFTDIEWGLR